MSTPKQSKTIYPASGGHSTGCETTALADQSARAFPFLHCWQNERAKLLNRLCKLIHTRRQKGQQLRHALRALVKTQKDKTFKSAPHKRIRLSQGSLLRHYYRWINCGQRPEAFKFIYKARQSNVPASLLAEFIRTCSAPGVVSMQAAYRLLKAACNVGTRFPGLSDSMNFTFGFRTFDRAVPRSMRAELHNLHKARRAERAAERRFNKFLAALHEG